MPKSKNPELTALKISKIAREEFASGKRLRQTCAKNHRWKGGRTLSHAAGYVRIKLSENDPFIAMADANRYVYEHRLLVAKRLGRCLTHNEVVHHDKVATFQNQDGKLILFPSSSEHLKAHHFPGRTENLVPFNKGFDSRRRWEVNGHPRATERKELPMNIVWTERKAGKEHKCDECGLPIKPGESYYEGVIAGGGLGAIKHPERLHRECWELFADKERTI